RGGRGDAGAGGSDRPRRAAPGSRGAARAPDADLAVRHHGRRHGPVLEPLLSRAVGGTGALRRAVARPAHRPRGGANRLHPHRRLRDRRGAAAPPSGARGRGRGARDDRPGGAAHEPVRRRRPLRRPAGRARRAVRGVPVARAGLARQPRQVPLGRAGASGGRHGVVVRRRAVGRPAVADVALGRVGRRRGAHRRRRIPHRAARGAVGRGASAGARAAARAAARTGVVTMPPVLSLPLPAQPAQPWPGGPQPVAATRPTVQPVVRWALHLFICSIPFEMPQRSLPIEIPTLVGCVFLLATLLDRRAAYRRIDVPLVAFTGYLWMFAVAALVNLSPHEPYVLKFFLEMLQVVLLFWTAANVMTDEPVRVTALRAFALACEARAALQV